jgi:hypothetical protein
VGIIGNGRKQIKRQKVREFYKRKIWKDNRVKEKDGRSLGSWKVHIWLNKITNE